MSGKKVWLITGAGRGMGVDFAKAALAAGNAVVATGRNTDAVSKAVGQAEDLLVVKLDVTSPADAEAAVKAAVDRFGRLDVLVNNAANFYGGYFEELTPEQIEHQLATGLIGFRWVVLSWVGMRWCSGWPSCAVGPIGISGWQRGQTTPWLAVGAPARWQRAPSSRARDCGSACGPARNCSHRQGF